MMMAGPWSIEASPQNGSQSLLERNFFLPGGQDFNSTFPSHLYCPPTLSSALLITINPSAQFQRQDQTFPISDTYSGKILNPTQQQSVLVKKEKRLFNSNRRLRNQSIWRLKRGACPLSKTLLQVVCSTYFPSPMPLRAATLI